MGRIPSKGNISEELRFPTAYFITFTCYGTWLHGNESGSVDKFHNIFGESFASVNDTRVSYEQKLLKCPPLMLDEYQRNIVMHAILDGCERRGWELIAAHVRTNHVHAVVCAELPPEKILAALKAYASKDLRKKFSEIESNKIWTRHGSTRYLWGEEEVQSAIHYVVKNQGDPMAVFCKPEWLE